MRKPRVRSAAALLGVLLSPITLAAPPQGQAELTEWWTAAGQIWLGETAYTIGSTPLTFEDGLCRTTLTSGALIPVYSGQAPVSERMIGLVWLGEGELAMRLESRGDVWRLANHLATSADVDEAELRPLLEGAPYTTPIDRGLLLSADPAVLRLLEGLQPMGAGTVYGSDGTADEVYVVTETRGGGRVRMVGVNLLTDRLHALELSGLDPQVMLRQDRLLREELGMEGQKLRALADFRTATPLRVASIEGNVAGRDGFDRWLTCYRDGMDAASTGYTAQAFAHGIDQDQRRHFMRLSGTPAPAAGTPERPALAPVSAESQAVFEPVRRGLERELTVESTLTLRATGGAVQHLTMRMPTGPSILGTWELAELTLADGTPLPWVGLSAGLSGGAAAGRAGDPQSPAAEGTIDRATTANLASGGTGIGMSGNAVASGGDASRSASANELGQSGEGTALAEQLAFNQTAYRYEILSILPAPIAAGEEVSVRLRWTARDRFARYSVTEVMQPDGEDMPATPRSLYRPLGHTTGPHPILPEILPSTPDVWRYTTTLGTPQPLLVSSTPVASGETVRSTLDESASIQWLTAEGQARQATVAVGRWETRTDAGTDTLPAIQTHLLARTQHQPGHDQLPAELRRIVVFMQQLLPPLPSDELELYQMMRSTLLDALVGSATDSYAGLIELQTVISPTVTAAGLLRDQQPSFTRYQLARQVAAQYWGQTIQPASARDQWLVDGLAGAYASLYLRAAEGPEVYAAHLDALRRRLEDPRELSAGRGSNTPWKKAGAQRPLSLTEPLLSDVPAGIRADYATYVLVELLRAQVGDDVFFSVVRRLAERGLEGTPLQTEDVQLELELASGQDLADFFDYWVHGARLPALTLDWTATADGRVQGCVTADAPFGRFAVPVRITSPAVDHDLVAEIVVTDGVGLFEAEGWPGAVDVALDPTHHIPAVARRTQKARSLDCMAGLSDAADDRTP